MAKFQKLFGGIGKGKHAGSRFSFGGAENEENEIIYDENGEPLYDDVENTIEEPVPMPIPVEETEYDESLEENPDFVSEWAVLEEMTARRRRLFGILGGVLLAALVIGFVALGFHANTTKKVYPNVSVSGIPVGGMTYDEAYNALDKAGYDNGTGTATVDIYANNVLIRTLEVKAEDANVKLSLDAAAQAAVEYGHGNFLISAFNYIGCIFDHQNLSVGEVSFDRKAVKEIIKQTAGDLDVSYMPNSYEIEEKELKVTKGVTQRRIDQDALYLMIYNAFKNSDFVRMKYVADIREPEGIDFEAISKKVYVEGKNATYNQQTGGIDGEVTGVKLNVAIAQWEFEKAEYGSTFTIPFVITEPTVKAADLQGNLFVDTLASRSTALTDDSNRNTNITLAAEAINGLVMNPGDVFSFNDTVGERTAAKGYKEAGAYVGGRTVQETGGGICQVSSTIYYCTLVSNLKTVDRENHMFPVSYLPLGMDATVNWGTLDFKFENSSQYPIKIVCYVEGSSLYVQILGTKANDHTFSVNYQTVSTTSYRTIERESASVSSRTVETSGVTGYVVDTYLTEYDGNGKEVKTTYITRSTYDSRDEVVLVPVGSTSSAGQTGNSGGNNSGESGGNSGGNNSGESGGNSGGNSGESGGNSGGNSGESGGNSGGESGGTTEPTPPDIPDVPTPPTPPVIDTGDSGEGDYSGDSGDLR